MKALPHLHKLDHPENSEAVARPLRQANAGKPGCRGAQGKNAQATTPTHTNQVSPFLCSSVRHSRISQLLRQWLEAAKELETREDDLTRPPAASNDLKCRIAATALDSPKNTQDNPNEAPWRPTKFHQIRHIGIWLGCA